MIGSHPYTQHVPPVPGRRPRAVDDAVPGDQRPAGCYGAITRRRMRSSAIIDRTYGQLADHVFEHAIGISGPLREHYLRGIAETPDATAWETEIGWPIFRT